MDPEKVTACHVPEISVVLENYMLTVGGFKHEFLVRSTMLLMGKLTISMAKVEYLIGGLEHEWIFSIIHIWDNHASQLTNSMTFQDGD